MKLACLLVNFVPAFHRHSISAVALSSQQEHNMLPFTTHTQLRPCIRRFGAPTASAVQQQQPWHTGLRRRQQQRHKQRSKAAGSEASSGNEVPQVDRDVIFDSAPDDAPPTASALQDTEALLQQLNLLKRCASYVVLCCKWS